MYALLSQLAQMTVASAPGTGPVTVGVAIPPFPTLESAGVVDGQIIRYFLADGAAWERGIGVYTVATKTFTRTVQRSSLGSSPINASINTTVNCSSAQFSGGGGGGSGIAYAQDFVSPGDFTPGTTTSLTLSTTPDSAASLLIAFDGIVQSHDTWSLAGAVITFSAAIPWNVQVVEAQCGLVGNNVFTVATLPAASGLAGVRAFVTDANSTTFLAIAVGGGVNAVPVVCDGTYWKIG
jgi:hypothetical protein